MLEDVKKALRISHNLLDEEITETIEAARLDLVRLNVSRGMVYESDNPLVKKAIITFCKAEYANDTKMAERFEQSYEYQADKLRKSEGYRGE